MEPVRLTLVEVDSVSWALGFSRSALEVSAGVGGPDDSFEAGVISNGRLGRGRKTRGASAIVYWRLIFVLFTLTRPLVLGRTECYVSGALDPPIVGTESSGFPSFHVVTAADESGSHRIDPQLQAEKSVDASEEKWASGEWRRILG
jgi:hypothetical protein